MTIWGLDSCSCCWPWHELRLSSSLSVVVSRSNILSYLVQHLRDALLHRLEHGRCPDLQPLTLTASRSVADAESLKGLASSLNEADSFQ